MFNASGNNTNHLYRFQTHWNSHVLSSFHKAFSDRNWYIKNLPRNGIDTKLQLNLHRSSLWKSNTEQPFWSFFYTLLFLTKITASVPGTIPYKTELHSTTFCFQFSSHKCSSINESSRQNFPWHVAQSFDFGFRLWLLNVPMMLLVFYKSGLCWFLRTSDV